MGSHYFTELFHIDESSHVLMLNGNFVGCALRQEAVVPHLIDWTTGLLCNLPPPPGGVDVPETRSAPHRILLWNSFVVLIRHNSIELYSRPSPSGGPSYIQTLRVPPIWEVVALDALSLVAPLLELLVLSSRGLELYNVEWDVIGSHAAYTRHLLVSSAGQRCSLPPWYHLHVNGNARRVSWLSVGDHFAPTCHYPQLVSMALPSPPTEQTDSLILWTNDLPQDPALWALPVLDFDQALGLTVIGNCFGELAIYDCVGSDPTNCCGLAVDFTEQPDPIQSMLSTTPLPLCLYLTPKPIFGETEPDEKLVSHWSQDNLGIDPRVWHTNWLTSTYWSWSEWQGNRGDFGWLLNHAYGLPASVVPQAYGRNEIGEYKLLVRCGGRYLIHDERGLSSFQLGVPPQPTLHPETRVQGDPQTCMRPTAYTLQGLYKGMFSTEFNRGRGRNRWIEQRERGGNPHRNLVVSLCDPTAILDRSASVN